MNNKDFLAPNKRKVATNCAYGSYRAKCNMVDNLGGEFIVCKMLLLACEYKPANDALPSNVIKLGDELLERLW